MRTAAPASSWAAAIPPLQRRDRAQRDGDAQGILDEFLHPAAAEVMAADEVRHQRRQPRADEMRGDRPGDRGAGHHATTRTGPRVAAVLGDDHRRVGDLGDLVPGRLGLAGRRPLGQEAAAGGTVLGDVIDDGVEPFRE